jgi:hypothetical protein
VTRQTRPLQMAIAPACGKHLGVTGIPRQFG